MAGFWENYGKENERYVSQPTSHIFNSKDGKKWDNYLKRKEREMLRRKE